MRETPAQGYRWLHYSLRWMMLAVLLVAAALALLVSKAREQHLEVEALEELGCKVYFFGPIGVAVGSSSPTGLWPKMLVWLRECLGDPNPQHVLAIEARDVRQPEQVLRRLCEFPYVMDLYFQNTPIGDSDLAKLRCLRHVRGLELRETLVTDAGMKVLAEFPKLEWLKLDGTRVTDNGLRHLEHLSGLQLLFLRDTQITDSGVEKLKLALPNCGINH